MTGAATGKLISEATVYSPGADGKQHPILRTEIEELITNSRSLMPEGLEKELSKQQLADVISYVAGASEDP